MPCKDCTYMDIGVTYLTAIHLTNLKKGHIKAKSPASHKTRPHCSFLECKCFIVKLHKLSYYNCPQITDFKT